MSEDERPARPTDPGHGPVEPPTKEEQVSEMLSALDQFIKRQESKLEEESAALVETERARLQELLAARMEVSEEAMPRRVSLSTQARQVGRSLSAVVARGRSTLFRIGESLGRRWPGRARGSRGATPPSDDGESDRTA